MIKKNIKILKKILPCFLILMVSLFAYVVKANEKITIVDFKYYDGHPSNGLLYSDNRLLLWGECVDSDFDNKILENIKSFELLYSGDVAYLTYDNKFYDTDILHEDIVAYDFSGDGVVGDIAYKDINDNLYVRDRGSNWNSFFVSGDEKIIATDVKDFLLVDHWDESTLMYTTNDGTLYALGVNYFGTKINEGNDFREVYALLENVRSFDSNYAVTNDGKLYFFSSGFIKPTIIYDDVQGDVKTFYGFERILWFVSKNDGTNNLVWVNIDDNGGYLSTETMEIPFKPLDINYNYVLGDDGNLYLFDLDNKEYSVFDANVKEVNFSNCGSYYGPGSYFYVLKNDNILYYYVINPDGIYVNEFVSALLHKDKFEEKNKLIKNVESIKYMSNGIIILKNGEVLRFGSNDYNSFNNPDLPSSFIPVQIDELINNGREIKSLEVFLSDTGVNKITLDDEIDYFATVVPYNAIDREVVWSSSNPDAISVTQDGVINAVGVGSSLVCVTLTSDDNIKDCTTVDVHPKISSIEIINGETIDAELYENIILTVKINPSDALNTEFVWSTSSKNGIDFYTYDYDNGKKLENNQIGVNIYAGGAYEITVKTKDGLYSDTIVINTVERVNSIELDIEDEYYDGVNNAFIYLSEDPTLQVGYKIYPTTATNKNVTWSSSDEEIATVDEFGKITAYKSGRTQITITSVDGGATRRFNLLVYNYAQDNIIVGDVNGDGEVNVLDLIRLRLYLSQQEESLQ